MEASRRHENYASDLHLTMGLSNIAALMHFIRSNIGSGVLSIPWAISHAGLVAGPVLLVVFVLITLSTMLRLVECAKLYSRKVGVPCLDYGEVAYYSLHFGPIKRFRPYARVGQITINLSIALLQFFICCVYYVFIAQNVRQVLVTYWPGIPEDRVIIAILWVPLTLITFNRNLSGFAWMSAIGNVLIVVAMLMIVKYLSVHLQPVYTLPFTKPMDELPMFLSTVAFTFEGVATVLPLENSMRSKNSFPWIYSVALACLGLVALVIGEMGYLAFGSSVCGTVSLNFPHNDIYSDAVRLLVALVVLTSFPLQFYVQMEIIWPRIEKKLQPVNRCCEFMTKMAVSSLLCIIAISVPFLGSVISLTGCLLTVPLQFIYPSLINLMTLSHYDELATENNSEFNERTRLQTSQTNCNENLTSERPIYPKSANNPMKLLSGLKDVIITIFGVLLVIFGMITSISNIIHDYQTTTAASTCRGGVGHITTNNETARFNISFSFSNSTRSVH